MINSQENEKKTEERLGSTWFTRTKEEESWNAISHAAACGLSLGYFFFLDNPACKVWGMGLFIGFLFSVMYHGAESSSQEKKEFLRMLDMTAIHITICTTTVAHLLALGRDSITLSVASMSFVSLVGVFFIVIRYGTNRFDWYALYTYLTSALVGCLIFYNNYDSQHLLGFTFLLGVIIYILGIAFYIRDSIAWYHTAWHVCVLIASSLHMYGIHRALN